MKTKGTFFSLSTLALTAVLLLSGCGSEKKKETSPSSTSKIVQVKQSSTSKKRREKDHKQNHTKHRSCTISFHHFERNTSEPRKSINFSDTKSSRSQSRPGSNSFKRNKTSSEPSTRKNKNVLAWKKVAQLPKNKPLRQRTHAIKVS